MCGFCDPGFLCALAGLLQVNVAPSDAELAAIPNRCPCGAGPRIAAAAQAAAAAIRREASDGRVGDNVEPETTDGFSLGSDAVGQTDGAVSSNP